MYGYAWGGMGWGMLLFWGLIIVGVVMLARSVPGERSDARPAAPPNRSALDILAQRYARGEIDKTEFEQKRRDLDAS